MTQAASRDARQLAVGDRILVAGQSGEVLQIAAPEDMPQIEGAHPQLMSKRSCASGTGYSCSRTSTMDRTYASSRSTIPVSGATCAGRISALQSCSEE